MIRGKNKKYHLKLKTEPSIRTLAIRHEFLRLFKKGEETNVVTRKRNKFNIPFRLKNGKILCVLKRNVRSVQNVHLTNVKLH